MRQSVAGARRPLPIRAVALLIAVLVLAVLVGGCQATSRESSATRVRGAGKILIAVDPSYPPLASLDDKGFPVGYEIDLAGEIARRLGVAPDYIGMDVGGIVDALIARKVDVAISGLPPAPEYGKQLAYSRPYFDAGQVIVSTSHVLPTTDALDGLSVGVESGSTADIEMRKLMPNLKNVRLKSYSTPDSALEDLGGAQLDAVVADNVTALEYAKRHPDLHLSTPFEHEYYVVTLRKPDVTLRTEIDGILDDLDREGYLRSLEQKWLR